jgi:hypothetical protein
MNWKKLKSGNIYYGREMGKNSAKLRALYYENKEKLKEIKKIEQEKRKEFIFNTKPSKTTKEIIIEKYTKRR